MHGMSGLAPLCGQASLRRGGGSSIGRSAIVGSAATSRSSSMTRRARRAAAGPRCRRTRASSPEQAASPMRAANASSRGSSGALRDRPFFCLIGPQFRRRRHAGGASSAAAVAGGPPRRASSSAARRPRSGGVRGSSRRSLSVCRATRCRRCASARARAARERAVAPWIIGAGQPFQVREQGAGVGIRDRLLRREARQANDSGAPRRRCQRAVRGAPRPRRIASGGAGFGGAQAREHPIAAARPRPEPRTPRRLPPACRRSASAAPRHSGGLRPGAQHLPGAPADASRAAERHHGTAATR